MKKCSVEGCGQDAKKRGMCDRHYRAAMRRGEISAIRVKGLSLKERLAKFSKANTKTGCIEWAGCKHEFGYGILRVHNRNVYAHRLAWELAHGSIPDDMHVLHKCDNPPCINPTHLFLGTQVDNVVDMLKKGRHAAARGELSGRAKLTEEQVRAIKCDSRIAKEIAPLYRVSTVQINAIKRGVYWGRVA